MTLNITALHEQFIVQVSDRRLSHLEASGSVKVSTDAANKAVVLSCTDAVLAITFTGLGSIGSTRVDDWLVDVAQREALCELDATAAIELVRQHASRWFRSIQRVYSGPHTFIVAGWRAAETRPQATVCFVTNSAADQRDEFVTQQETRTGLYVTGWTAAFSREERRRLDAGIRNASSGDDIETALVNGIRNAASRDNGTPIGKDCMSIVLLAGRTTLAKFHPEGATPHSFGPHLVWYKGGRNFAVRAVDALPDGNYGIAFGDNVLQIRSARIDHAREPKEMHAGFQFRITEAKYHDEPVSDAEVIRFVGG